MDRKQIAAFRQLVEDLMDRLQPDVAAITEQARGASGGQAGNELSNAPMHLGDTGTEEYLHDLNATLLENQEHILQELQGAIARLDDGTFGTCENCSKDIATERLQAIPYTRYCIRCADIVNDEPDLNINRGRPSSPRDTLAPEGEMNESGRHGAIPLETEMSTNGPRQNSGRRNHDEHAVGTAGGGTAVGGLAGSTEGRGDPNISELDEAMGSSNFDLEESRYDDSEPKSGPTGGAVGGTPAGKRTR